MRRNIDLPVDEMVKRYEAGETTWALARGYDVCQETICRRLYAAGVVMRPCGFPAGHTLNHGRHKRGGPLHTTDGGYRGTLDREGKICRVHRACWVAYHGAIPDGHVVHHLDGNPANNDIENLSCVSHGEHWRLHNIKRE